MKSQSHGQQKKISLAYFFLSMQTRSGKQILPQEREDKKIKMKKTTTGYEP
jgi:hypothetical protein